MRSNSSGIAGFMFVRWDYGLDLVFWAEKRPINCRVRCCGIGIQSWKGKCNLAGGQWGVVVCPPPCSLLHHRGEWP